MTWNFDMTQAPRGETKTRKQKIRGGATAEMTYHEPAHIIAASKCGVVTKSRWLPDQNRWNMFSKGEDPIAWQPWPDHPEATK